ncbi:hypothetical protein NLU13_3128 [Sarocladium strictum]|uniref:Yeast cell wall synthesis Kre9/Knh1-like N-terminal domain-containing protein n=1 Tax=Sarocladium strictum TaxID=5046 RepID=A0AA39LA05_SARSR|nr:hypothetical protein NLU13_3128 [Sarocladium strictum]
MKFSLSMLAAFAATAFAQTADFDPITVPLKSQEVPAGKTFEIVWEAPAKYAAGTVSLHLIGGATQDTQVPLMDIAAGIPNSAEKYAWNVDASLGADKFYGLVIKYESNPAIFQYSNPFRITKAEGADAKKADTTTTISKSYGEKTVTLSSCETTSTTSIVTPPPVSTPTTTPVANITTTYVKPPTTIKTLPVATTTSIQVVPSAQPTTPTVPVTGAGVRVGASSVALVGAFVVAIFAL